MRRPKAIPSDTINGLVIPASIATCWYVAHERESTDPRSLLEPVADVMRTAPIGRSALRTALQNLDTEDFEDSYLAAAGKAAGASAIATRDESDFTSTALTPYHPTDLVEMLDE